MTHTSLLVIVNQAKDEEDAVLQAEQKLEHYSCYREVEPRVVGFLSFGSYYDTLKVIQNFENEEYAKISFENPESREAEILSEELGEEIRIIDDKYVRVSTYNQEARWDWYELGGRWEGFIPSKLSFKGVNVCRKQDMDIDGAKRIALSKALAEYEKYEEVTKSLVPGPSFEEVLEGIPQDLPDVSRNRAAGAQYRQDPWVKAVSAMVGTFSLNAHSYFFVGDGEKEAYLENATNGFMSPFALLTGEDEWFETGRGYLTASSSAEWNTLFAEQVEHAEEESWFLIYDLHI